MSGTGLESTIRDDRNAVAAPPPLPSIWQAIKEALRGAHGRAFTAGPVGRAIFILAVPMVLEPVVESVFAVVDVFVVGHLGADVFGMRERTTPDAARRPLGERGWG